MVTSMYDGVCRSGTRRRRQTKENSDRHILINFCEISINGICVFFLKKKIPVFESDEEYVIVGRRRQWR